MTEAWEMSFAQRQREERAEAREPSAQVRPASGKQTTVEEGTEFQGILKSTCPIVVKGQIEGEIYGPSLRVSESGLVAGTVKVDEISSEGVLSGEFDADTVQLSGQVRDKTVIRARSMEVSLSPEKGRMEVVFGECDLEVGDVPSKEDAIQKALATPEEPVRAGQKGNGELEVAAAKGKQAGKDDGTSAKKKGKAEKADNSPPPAE